MTPIIVPTTMTSGKAIHEGIGWLVKKNPNEGSIQPAAREQVSPTTAPTERSMPPVRMTKVCPAATIEITAACCAMFARLLVERNGGAVTQKKPTTSRSPSSEPSWLMIDSSLGSCQGRGLPSGEASDVSSGGAAPPAVGSGAPIIPRFLASLVVIG